jgi:hypothetical protein
MRFGWIWVGLAAMFAVVQGCGDAPEPTLDQAYSAPGKTKAGGGGQAASATGAGGGTALATGLPCDLSNLLITRCASCHGANPVAGAPMSLLSYDDLEAPSPSDPKKTNAAAALARMQDANSPMPPLFDANGNMEAGPSAAEIAILSAWIKGGEQHGTCGSGGATGTGGATGAGGATGTGGTSDAGGSGGSDPTGAGGATGGSGTSAGGAGAGTAGTTGTAGSGGAAPCTTDTWTNFGQAFFKTNCTLGCHNHVFGSTTPSYTGVKNNASLVKADISNGSMPPSGSQKPTSSDKTRILKWIACGEPM